MHSVITEEDRSQTNTQQEQIQRRGRYYTNNTKEHRRKSIKMIAYLKFF